MENILASFRDVSNFGGSTDWSGGYCGRRIGDWKAITRGREGVSQENGFKESPGGGGGKSLRIPIGVVVLRSYDDNHCENGTEHHGCDAHGQGDEGEIPSLPRCDLR